MIDIPTADDPEEPEFPAHPDARDSYRERRLLRPAARRNADTGREVGSAGDDARRRLEALERILNAVNVGVWEWYPATDRTVWSSERVRLSGRGAAEFDGTLRDALRNVHREDRHRVIAALRASATHKVAYNVEFRVVRFNGSVSWLHSTGEMERTDDGEEWVLRGVTLDATRRKLDELDTARRAAIVASSAEGILSKTLKGYITSWNDGCERLFGYSAEEAIGRHISLIIPPEERNQMNAILETIRRGNRVDQLETVRRHKDGRLLDVSISVSPIIEGDGAIVGAASIKRDITAHKRTERALRESEQRFRLIAENATDLIFLIDGDGRFVYGNGAFARELGYSPEELVGHRLADIVHPQDRASLSGDRLEDFRLVRADGSSAWVEGRYSTVEAGSGSYGMGILRDVGDRRDLEQRLQHEAWHDPLTGLPNRLPLHDRLRHVIERDTRERVGYAVLMLDLDAFKAVNDTLGHAAGDDLLKQFGERVRHCLRPSDTFARLGGDEFVILLAREGKEARVRKVAERILDIVKEPFSVEAETVKVGVSIGAVLSGPALTSPEVALREADKALYRAKAAGKGQLVLTQSG